ncbi:MAG: glycoside hydrolase family 25 protein [Eubacteriales bacterium]|nr:glycoside hydrolase family 25 protein [Eubacteriales bacterium]
MDRDNRFETLGEERGEREPRRSRGRRQGKSPVAAILLTFILTAVIAGLAGALVSYKYEEKKYAGIRTPVVLEESEALDTMRENLENGNSVMTSLRSGYKNYLIVYDDSRYIFHKINYDMKMNNLSKDNVVKLDSGEWQYKKNGKVVSHKGIDVSSHQGDIDWKAVSEDGVEFAIIRSVYRGYGAEGNLVTDKKFEENIKGAIENNIAAGVYMFSQALNEKELDEEIELLLKNIEPYEIKGPVVLDVEETAGGTGRADGLSKEERTAFCKRFCEKIKEAGYRPMLYFNYEAALLMVNIEELDDYEKWFATYTTNFYYPYNYSIWQYSNTGRVKGIEGDVDLDISFEKIK